MGPQNHNWSDYNVVKFSTEFPAQIIEWDRKLSRFWGKEYVAWWDLKMEIIAVKRVDTEIKLELLFEITI